MLERWTWISKPLLIVDLPCIDLSFYCDRLVLSVPCCWPRFICSVLFVCFVSLSRSYLVLPFSVFSSVYIKGMVFILLSSSLPSFLPSPLPSPLDSLNLLDSLYFPYSFPTLPRHPSSVKISHYSLYSPNIPVPHGGVLLSFVHRV